jgi:hypothetical protein
MRSICNDSVGCRATGKRNYVLTVLASWAVDGGITVAETGVISSPVDASA